MAKHVLWSDDQVRALNEMLAEHKRRRRHSQTPNYTGVNPPNEFRVGKPTEDIPAGETGEVVLWYRLPDSEGEEVWQESEQTVLAYVWRDGRGVVEGEKVHLHRHADAMGVRWVIDSHAGGVWSGYLEADQTITSAVTAVNVPMAERINSNSAVFGTPAAGFSFRLNKIGLYVASISLVVQLSSPYAYSLRAYLLDDDSVPVPKSMIKHFWGAVSAGSLSDEFITLSRQVTFRNLIEETDYRLMCSKYVVGSSPPYGDFILSGENEDDESGCSVDVAIVGEESAVA